MGRGGRIGLAVAGTAIAAVAVVGCGSGSERAAAPKAPTTGQLVQRLLTSPLPRVRNDAARRLASQLSPALTRRVVAAAPKTARGQLGVELLRDRYVVVYRHSATKPGQRVKAIRALALVDDVVSARAVAAALTGDRDAFVRKTAVSALSHMKRSARLVAKQLVAARYRTSGPKDDIESGLVAIGVAAVPSLLQELPGTLWAEDVVSRIGPPAVPLLRSWLAHGSFTQKAAASVALVAVGKRRPALVRADVPRIVDLMMRRLAAQAIDLQACDVLARVGKPALDVLLPLARKSYLETSGLERQEWGSAVFALVRMSQLNPKVTAGLVAELKGHDYDLIADLHNFYIQLGRPGSEAALIAALDARGDATMALDFLNSGNAKLDRGARDWAARHGYTVTTRPGQGPPPSWGTANQSF